MKIQLRFPIDKISHYAEQYSYSRSEQEVINNSKLIVERGYLNKVELQTIALWKTPRSKPRVESNSEDLVNEVTRVALTTNNEKLRIEVLTLLGGIGWPTASTILHFYHKEKFPIIDFRALYSINCEHILPKHYNYEFWQAYVGYTRSLAEKTNLTMRTIDQALWQFSKLTQKPK